MTSREEYLRQLEERLAEAESRQQEEARLRHEAEARLHEAEGRQREEARLRQEAEKHISGTTLRQFLGLCHDRIFLNLRVQTNTLRTTSGGVTKVDGKHYPRRLRRWRSFQAEVLDAGFAKLDRVLGQQPLMPPPSDLAYVSRKLRDKTLASEEDLKRFEFLAIEECVLDALRPYIERAGYGLGSNPGSASATARSPLGNITFSNYPFGVIATTSDEEPDETQSQERRRGRARPRQTDDAADDYDNRNRPLIIKDDRPAYLGALAVAKRDMDEAQAAAEAREQSSGQDSGSRKKRRSPERTKLHPDQWCFRSRDDEAVVPLFVIEYKAAHKLDGALIRRILGHDTNTERDEDGNQGEAASLMEDCIGLALDRHIPSRTGTHQDRGDAADEDGGPNAEAGAANPPTEDANAKLNLGRVITQAFNYMVEYGLQYIYLTTGEIFVFFFLDPDNPSTVYYHLEEPRLAVQSTDGDNGRDDLDHSAVMLVLAFTLAALDGRYMSQRWKKEAQRTLPRWPNPYADMVHDSASDTSGDTGIIAGKPVLPANQQAQQKQGCADPEKPTRRRQGPDSDDEYRDSTSHIGTASHRQGATETTLVKRATRSSATTTKAGKQGTQRPASTTSVSWPSAFDIDTFCSQSPQLPYCTQACLSSLQAGKPVDPACPNVHLHLGTSGEDLATGVNSSPLPSHPISAAEFREQLIGQLAADMDHDCDSLERYGMFGAIGALFKVVLSRYGYCVVAKGVQRAHRKRLEREAATYRLLERCQGRLIPVSLGVIHLADAYRTLYGAHIEYMLLMAHAGESLSDHSYRLQKRMRERKQESEDTPEMLHIRQANRQMWQAIVELKSYGVSHGDEADTNAVWNNELQRVMLIDFDRAIILDTLETPSSPNKQKRRKQPRPPGQDRVSSHSKRAKTLDETDGPVAAEKAHHELRLV